jgi:hypothetical protein
MLSSFSAQDLLGLLIPSPDTCRDEARNLRLEHPGLSPDAVAQMAVKDARKWAVAAGAISGVAASPLTFAPAAVADAVAMLRIEGHLAGTVAALLDPASLDDPDAFQRDVLRIIFPAAVGQALRRAGIAAGEKAAKAVVARAFTRGMAKEVLEVAAKRLGIRLTEKALATKTVPLVGAGIGAAWNWAELQVIGRRAISYHGGDAGASLGDSVKVRVRRVYASGAETVQKWRGKLLDRPK